MDKQQALNILFDLALSAELPKGLTGKEASNYIGKIHEAKALIESCIKTDKEK